MKILVPSAAVHPIIAFPLALAGAGLLFPVENSVAPPVFSPGPDAKVERVFTWEESSRTTDAEILLDGEPTTEVPTVASDLDTEGTLGLTDTFVRSDLNRPLELVRTFDDIAFEGEGQLKLDLGAGVAELEISCDSDSELDGIGVEFLWDADAEAYDRKYADDYEGSDELLAALEPGGHFIECLPSPDEDIDVGDSWDIDPAQLLRILHPSGQVPLVKESDMDAIDGALDPLLMPGVMETLGGEASGEITAELKSVLEGTVTLEIRVDVEFVSDQANAVGAMLGTVAPDDIELELEDATYTSVLEGKGTLVWDTEKNLARSFRLDLSTTLEIKIAVHVDGMGVDAPFELLEEREGTLKMTMDASL